MPFGTAPGRTIWRNRRMNHKLHYPTIDWLYNHRQVCVLLEKSTRFTDAKAILKRLSFQSIIIVHNSSKPSLQLKNCLFLPSLFSSPHSPLQTLSTSKAKCCLGNAGICSKKYVSVKGLEENSVKLWGMQWDHWLTFLPPI